MSTRRSSASVSKGQSVALQVPAYPGETFTGTVTAIAPGSRPENAHRERAHRAARRPAGRLRPGMLAQVSIVTGNQTNALLVPREAILGTPVPNGQATVVTLDGSRAQRRRCGSGW